MATRMLSLVRGCGMLGLVLALLLSGLPPATTQAQVPVTGQVTGPSLLFVENAGQFADGARFLVHGNGLTLWLAEDAIWLTILQDAPRDGSGQRLDPAAILGPPAPGPRVFDLPVKGANVKFSFAGANPHPRLEPFNRLTTHISYFSGSDPGRWHADVPAWGGVRYVDLYPGINLELTGAAGQVVPRLVAGSGADLSAVRLRVEGAGAVAVDGDALVLRTAAGDATWPLLRVDRPGGEAAAQPLGALAFEVSAPFRRTDPNQPTAIGYLPSTIGRPPSPDDNAPSLWYGTFLGGGETDGGLDIALGTDRSAFVTGMTYSTDFPTTAGAFDPSQNGSSDAFVAKLNPSGSALQYATFLGGGGYEVGEGIFVDDLDTAYVTGTTASSDFPTTLYAFDTTYNGNYDAFAVRLNGFGTGLDWATFLGGIETDLGYGISYGFGGQTYVTGYTFSPDFPTTPQAFDRTLDGGDGFVIAIAAQGRYMNLGTFLGGSGYDLAYAIALDASGSIYVTGDTESSDFPTTASAFDKTYNGGYTDAFVVELNQGGSGLVYGTFLGGSDSETGYAIALHGSGAAYVTGNTRSSDFPTTQGAFDTTYNGGDYYGDAFVAKLNADGSGLDYGTFLGAGGSEVGHGIGVDGSEVAYVAGETSSSGFPTTPGAFDTSYNGGSSDAFVARLDTIGPGLLCSTFLGGSGDDWGYNLAVDASGGAYVTGETLSSDFPTTPGAYDRLYAADDAFVGKLDMTEWATYSISGRVTDGSGHGISGVTVTAGAGYTVVTDPNGNYVLTHLIDGLYNFSASKVGYALEPPSRTAAVPPHAIGQDFTGTPPDMGFRPNPDGYSFPNGDSGWGKYPSSAHDYTSQDMITMFGEDAVCDMVGNVCFVKPVASEWGDLANRAMNGGHCDGMASTSLRFFKGLDDPADFQPGASSTHDLELGNARAHIAYYFVRQFTDPVKSYREQNRQNPLQTLLDQVSASLQGSAPDPVTLAVWSGRYGHALTPYAIGVQGNGKYWVLVYDNNHPGDQNRHVEVDTNTNGWNYLVGGWEGDDSTHSLALLPISVYTQPAVCPWCNESRTLEGAPAAELFLVGQGHLLITDAQGRRIGYAGDEFVNEVPGAYESTILGGLGMAMEPLYTLPLTQTYTILLDGQTLTQTSTVDLTQFGPNYAASAEGIALQPGAQDQVVIATDGTSLGYSAGLARQASLALALDGTEESYRLQVSGADIGAGQAVTLSADPEQGWLAFRNAQAGAGVYNLEVTRVSTAGDQRFEHTAIAILATDTHYVDYGAWDGSGSMMLYVDHGSDGDIDETLELENRAIRVYLPLGMRTY